MNTYKKQLVNTDPRFEKKERIVPKGISEAKHRRHEKKEKGRHNLSYTVAKKQQLGAINHASYYYLVVLKYG